SMLSFCQTNTLTHDHRGDDVNGLGIDGNICDNVSQKHQGGSACAAHRASPSKQMCRLSNRLKWCVLRRVSFLSVPVLSTFLMTTATCPCSMELSSLTMRMRQVQRTSKDRARRMRPTARSGKLALAKTCLPESVPTSGLGAMAAWTTEKKVSIKTRYN
uniref:Uncharacterized protein n=1 Tax=Seriola dumerili TaxID=41447 RepID=A0A3B4VE27_SERDU